MKEKNLNTLKNDDITGRLLPLNRLTLTLLIILGLVFSIILTLHQLDNGLLIGCNGGSQCDQVLKSPWSMLFGIIPVSSLAVGLYSSMFVASCFIGPKTETSVRQLAWNALLVMAGTIAGSAIWFIILQKWVIGSFCIYCLTTHLIGITLAVLITWRAGKEFESHSTESLSGNRSLIRKIFLVTHKRSSVFGKILIGLALAMILVIIQIGFTPSISYQDGDSQTNILTIDYKTSPLIGSPEAPYIITVLFDYQCPHCQKIHFMLNEIVKRYGGKIAFALCPTPLNTHCNPYIPRDVDAFKNSCDLAKIGLAVWHANREVFPAFENWIFSFESGDKWQQRDIQEVRMKAIELIGKEKFENALADPWIIQYLKACIRFYGQSLKNGNGGIPKLMFQSRWVIPQPRNVDDLVRILQKSLLVPEL